MKLPPFKLDLWLAAHEFATPPIRYNLASSTGPAVDAGRNRWRSAAAMRATLDE